MNPIGLKEGYVVAESLSYEQQVYEAAMRWYRTLEAADTVEEFLARANLARLLRDVWQKRA